MSGTDVSTSSSIDGVPAYVGGGDPALADYYPAWLDNLAGDVIVEGETFAGAPYAKYFLDSEGTRPRSAIGRSSSGT